MNILFNEEGGTYTLTPENNIEAEWIKKLPFRSKRNLRIAYGGRSGAQPNDDYSKRMRLDFDLGGNKFTLQSSNDESEANIRSLRDAIYFAAGGIVVLSRSKGSIVVCVTFCKLCKGPISDMGRGEWKVCEKCATVCNHEYIDGFVHGNTAQVLAEGQYCGKCGKGNPNHEVKPLLNHNEKAVLVIVPA